jgi:hypothetical protein
VVPPGAHGLPLFGAHARGGTCGPGLHRQFAAGIWSCAARATSLPW